MKYFSFFFLITFMTWTWKSSQNYQTAMNMQVILDLEEQIQKAITTEISERRPDAHNIRFLQSYGETIQPGKEILLHVKYAFDEGNSKESNHSTQDIVGSIYLKSENGINWTTDQIKIENEHIEFHEALHVHAQNQ